jgi:feruloyl esterase
MIRRILTAVALVCLPSPTPLAQTAVREGAACADLTTLTIPDVVVNASAMVPAGSFTPPGAKTPLVLPAFCRVEATARPTDDSEIRIEVWIPPAGEWNGKFQGVGNGGYQGAISYAALANALRRGYATASTDTGHTGDDVIFGKGHPEKVVDFGWRAIHVMTDTAKLVVRGATGRFADKSYFVGCSSGGHQAMSEAQRFPGDYDGIVAGAPANNRIRQTLGFMWGWSATHRADGTPILDQRALTLVTRAVVAACDGDDGLKDGLVEDPRTCRFDPAVLTCKGSNTDDCLTTEQVGAVIKVYDGLKSPRTGELIFSGWPRGSEAFGENPFQSWRQYLINPPEPPRIGVFRYFLFHDPAWQLRSLDYDRDLAYALERLPHLHAMDTNLAPFKQRGGKLIAYAGWVDPVVPPQDNVAYYEAVAKTLGGYEATRDFFRLFMAPGMGHCTGGPGPNQFDALGALERWVEKGEAPDTILATVSVDGVTRSRPLCPYPQVARYRGTGSTDEAASFACVAPKPAKKK